MTQIRIDTQRVRDVGRQFRSDSDQINDIGNALQSAINSLDTWAWDGRSRADAEPMLDQVHPGSRNLASDLERLGKMLQHVADRFENEDNTAARELEDLPWVEFGLVAETTLGISPPGNTKWEYDKEIKFKEKKGDLFKKGWFDKEDIQFDDVAQRRYGDCSLMSSLAAIAQSDPNYIRNMIRENEDGTYSVRFYDSEGNPYWSPSVEASFPVQEGPCGTEFNKAAVSSDNEELWPSIIEKAYAASYGGYDEVNEGAFPADVMRHLTGQEVYEFSATKDSKDQLWTHLTSNDFSGNPMVVCFEKSNSDLNIEDQHSYMIKDVDPDSGLIYLYNPWGYNHPDPITIDQLVDHVGAYEDKAIGVIKYHELIDSPIENDHISVMA